MTGAIPGQTPGTKPLEDRIKTKNTLDRKLLSKVFLYAKIHSKTIFKSQVKKPQSRKMEDKEVGLAAKTQTTRLICTCSNWAAVWKSRSIKYLEKWVR